ncbi:MAG: GC-type dockerin domain-anchored protein, partial [Planctomycetota bacterium]
DVTDQWYIDDIGVRVIADDPTCRADLDGDGELTIFDFLEFQNLFSTGDLRADFDGDGVLNIFDFLEFQNEFATGC